MNEKEYLKSKGWFTWYNENYWCHNQFDSEERDCTNWGMNIDDAYKFEIDPVFRNKILITMTLISSILKIKIK